MAFNQHRIWVYLFENINQIKFKIPQLLYVVLHYSYCVHSLRVALFALSFPSSFFPLGALCSSIKPGLIFLKMLSSMLAKRSVVIYTKLFAIMLNIFSSFIFLSVYMNLYFPSFRHFVICFEVMFLLGILLIFGCKF